MVLPRTIMLLKDNAWMVYGDHPFQDCLNVLIKERDLTHRPEVDLSVRWPTSILPIDLRPQRVEQFPEVSPVYSGGELVAYFLWRKDQLEVP